MCVKEAPPVKEVYGGSGKKKNPVGEMTVAAVFKQVGR